MNLNFKTEEQKLIRVDTKTVAENSANYLFAVFELDVSWEGFAKKAVFEHRGKAYSKVLEAGRCAVPCEVISADGFYISLIGLDGAENVRITSTQVKVKVEKGPKLEAENACEPTLTELEQLTAAVGELKSENEDIRNRLEEYVPSEPSVTEETDPTVPDWAKQPDKPTYTAEEVGADKKGIAVNVVAMHNADTDAHSNVISVHDKEKNSHSDIREKMKYVLIRSITVSAEDLANSCSGIDVEADGGGLPLSLKAVTCFCSFPAAEAKSALDVLIKTESSDGYRSVHRRTEILNTAARYYRVSAENEGYWTARSVLATDAGASNDQYGSFARNAVSGNAIGIRVATGGAVFPVGTAIEIWGVKA